MIAVCAIQLPNAAVDSGFAGSEILDYIKLIAILACVLVAVILVLRLGLPKLTGIRASGSGPIQIAASAPLEPRKNLYVIKAGSDYFLVATSESAVHWLSALERESIEPLLRPQGQEPRTVEFSRFIKTFRQRGGAS